MRTDPIGSALGQRNRSPRHVVSITYNIASIYITSSEAIAEVPGDVHGGALGGASVVSYSLNPDEGRSDIGGFSFDALDVDGDLTAAVREQLQVELDGIRGATVRYWTGDTDDFGDETWTLVLTQTVHSVSWKDGAYTIKCIDRLRELRQSIFDSPSTRITTTLEAEATTIDVVDSTDFTLFEHSAAYTDAPSQTVGYAIINKTGEIIRYASKTTGQLTGVTRGIGNTVPTKIEITAGTEGDRLPEIEQFPYYEGSGVDIAFSLMTGETLDGRALPIQDHAGVLLADVDADSFENIGTDLYDPANPDRGFVLRFIHLKKDDAKRFIEEQLLWPMGCYLAITPEGKLKLMRLPRILSDAVASVTLNDADIISHGDLNHELAKTINRIEIDWNYDGDGYTRTSEQVNLGSISVHGLGETFRRELRGLTVQRHTAQTIRRIFEWLTDLYGAPPQTISAEVSSRFNRIEVGDVIRLNMASVRDFAGVGSLNRAFLVVGSSMDWVTGALSLDLFGSSATVLPDQPVVDTTPLSDAYYVSEGTALTSALTISGGAVTASGTLSGHADMNNAAAIFYYEGDLTINAGVTVQLDDNVQLRVRGTLTVNGTITGLGRGIPAITEVNTVGFSVNMPAIYSAATLGSTRAGMGVMYVNGGNFYAGGVYYRTNEGLPALPRANVTVENGILLGIPSECRGTPGIYGTPVISSDQVVRGLGGAGGAGGAGLVIVCRGLVFGVNGSIDLSGESGATGQAGDVVYAGNTLRPGTGGGGAAGGLYVFLDDTGAVLPDLAGNFIANHGSTVVSGNPIDMIPPDSPPASPWQGRDPGIGASDNWQSSSIVQWLPLEEQLGEGAPEMVPTPTFLSATGKDYGIEITLEALPEAEYDLIELFASITNDRADAVAVTRIRAPFYVHSFDGIRTRYYWARALQGARRSEWSSAADAGFEATGGSLIAQIPGGWVETFDGYTSGKDFLREWDLLSGTPTLEIAFGGENGSKVLRCTGLARLSLKRNIPLEPGRMYEVGIRYRLVTAEASNDRFSAGFYGTVRYDAGAFIRIIKIDALGDSTTYQPDEDTIFESAGSGPNCTLGNSMELGLYQTPGEWVVHRNYLHGGTTTYYTQHALGGPQPRDGFPGAPHRARGLQRYQLLDLACTGVKPALDLNRIAGTTAVVEIDTMWMLPLESVDPFQPRLLDGNFSADAAMRYWYWNVSALPQITRGVGAGVSGSDAIVFEVDGATANMFVRNRFALSTLANATVVVRISYKITNVVNITAGGGYFVMLHFLQKETLADSRNNYTQFDAQVEGGLVDTDLNDDGAFHVEAISFTVPAEFHEADGFEVSVGLTPQAADEYRFTLAKVAVAQV